ncbi:uncharacterized protein LOC114953050 [Acropora millepora]|uniref:uncharacterized protein LOC114953050 n=1 Tax=Acropora millepora TaxID=45264 RepID=UPI001CF2BCF9|nr:uncharacterized protein LOC114953050 [Acropora millepora]
MSNFMQINRVCEFFLDQTNSSNLPAFPLMSYPGPPGSPRHRFFHGSLPDPTWMSRSSCILTRLFPEFTQMFLHTLLETRDFDLLSTLETLLDLRYRPRSVTILPGVPVRIAEIQPWTDRAAAQALVTLANTTKRNNERC